MSTAPAESVLLGLIGLEIDGGIASVARCVARTLDDEVREHRLARADRVLLHDDPTQPPAPPLRGDQLMARSHQALFVWQMWRSLRRHRPDLVFFDGIGPARSMLLPLPGLRPPRYAVFCHGIELGRAREGPHARTLRGAWRLLANSEHTAAVLRESAPDAAERIRTVPLCIDPRRTESWQQPSFDPTDEARAPAAIIVGRIWSEEQGKGHDALLEAWPSVRQQVPGAELWIVGAGDDCTRLEGKARSLQLGDAARFLGRVSDAELSRLYRRATVLAMPSRQEGFGLVYAEAMWHGLPCIGSTADAAREVILDGETGCLVPYGDTAALTSTLVSLFRDPPRCRALGEAGKRRAMERFGYPRFRADLLAALELG